MRAKPALRTWIWPLPPVARRLWLIILMATAYSLLVYLFARQLITQLPGWSSEFGLVNGIVMGVLVGIRTRAAFDRWFEGQKLWGDVLIQTRNLALKVAHLVRTDEIDRKQFAALVTGFARALTARLRGLEARFDAESGIEPLPPDAKHIPAHIAGRLYALAARWYSAGKVDLPGLWALETNVRALMDAAGNCERVALSPVPVSFHALLRHGLMLSVLLAPWHLIHALGIWALPVQALIIYFLFGVELTAEEIENPFGTDVDDLPLGMYCDTVHRDVADILAATSTQPLTRAIASHPMAGTIAAIAEDNK
jgi:putative membrane protein